MPSANMNESVERVIVCLPRVFVPDEGQESKSKAKGKGWKVMREWTEGVD